MNSNVLESGTVAGVQIARGLKDRFPNHKKLLALALQWTGKEPFLTQALLRALVNSDTPPMRGQEASWVGQIVRTKIIACWDSDPALRPLQNISDRLIATKQRGFALLGVYQRLLNHEIVMSSNTPEQRELRMLGLVTKQQGRLKIHNPIYQEVFDQAWVEKILDAIREQLARSEEDILKDFEVLERKLYTSQTEIIARIEDGQEVQDSSKPLYEVLRDVTARVGYMVGADRTTIFLLNDEKTELWSLVAESETGELLDIRVRVGDGIAGQVAEHKQVIHIPENVYDDPRSARVQEADRKFNYQTRNILAFPILNDDFEIVAVIQLLNKIQKEENQPAGFSHQDLESLAKCVIPIRRILEGCQNSYEGIRKAQATAALAEATRSLNQVNLSTDAILERVMDAAKKLLNADRSTLWLYDRQRGDLWTDLPGKGKIRCEVGVGFAGHVAETQEPKIVPFDLYDDPSAENAKKTDAQTRYRTCSLLCMPVLSPDGDLLGVTQLVNKRKPGSTDAYDPAVYPQVPEFFKTSFDKADRQAMQVFNERVGAILQFAQAHETLKQSAQVEPEEAVYQTLQLFGSVLSRTLASGTGRHTALYTLLHLLTEALQQAIAAEYVHIFLVDSDRRQLWTLAPDPHNRDTTELVMPADRGVAAKVLLDKQAKKSSKVAKIADDLVHLGLAPAEQESLHSILLLPILDEQHNYVAIARLLNARSREGFSHEDVENLQRRILPMLPILQAFQSFRAELAG